GEDAIFIGAHGTRALADRAGCVVAQLGVLLGKVSGRRIEVKAFRLQNIAADAQLPRRGQQIAASLAMEAAIFGYGFEDVGWIGWKRGELIDHDIRRGCLDRGAHRLRIEGIDSERLGAEFAKAIDAAFAARHAGHFMAELAQRAHQRQTDGARGAGDEYFHSHLRWFIPSATKRNSILSSY